MTSRVLIDSNGIMLTIRTFQVSGLLLGNGNSCPADFFGQLRRRFLNPNGCSLHYHTSNGSTYSLNGRSTMYPSCKGAKLMDGKAFKGNVGHQELAAWVEGLGL